MPSFLRLEDIDGDQFNHLFAVVSVPVRRILGGLGRIARSKLLLGAVLGNHGIDPFHKVNDCRAVLVAVQGDVPAGLDRHWRNARTLASHNPRIYKHRIIGDFAVNGTPPPYQWRIGASAG